MTQEIVTHLIEESKQLRAELELASAGTASGASALGPRGPCLHYADMATLRLSRLP